MCGPHANMLFVHGRAPTPQNECTHWMHEGCKEPLNHVLDPPEPTPCIRAYHWTRGVCQRNMCTAPYAHDEHHVQLNSRTHPHMPVRSLACWE